MHSFSFRKTSVATLALLGAVAAFDPKVDLVCEEEGICLTSFIWCSADGKDCYFPEGTLPLEAGSSIPIAVLSRGGRYEISWTRADPDLPVLVEWLFAVDTFPAADGPSTDLQAQWSANVSGSDTALWFQPDTILKTFPDANPQGLSPAEAIVSISGVSNHIRISQPGSGLKAVPSNQFSVQSDWAFSAQEKTKIYESDRCAKRERKWKIGVGIGVGLGGALLIATAAFFALRRQKTSPAPTKSP